MAEYPSAPHEWRPEGAFTFEDQVPDSEHIAEMVAISRDIQRSDGFYYLKPIGGTDGTQWMHFVDHRQTQTSLWFEHLHMFSESDACVSHGIVDGQTMQFLLYQQNILLTEPTPQPLYPSELLTMSRLSRQLINDQDPSISREDILSPASEADFISYYEDIAWLRQNLY